MAKRITLADLKAVSTACEGISLPQQHQPFGPVVFNAETVAAWRADVVEASEDDVADAATQTALREMLTAWAFSATHHRLPTIAAACKAALAS